MGNSLVERNVGLDLLRSLCILYIVGYWHMFGYTKAFPQYYNVLTLRFTWIILATFIFLSGYFIGLVKVDTSKKRLIHFYRKRFKRIYPLYFLALAIFYILGMSDLWTSIKASIAISMFFKPTPPTLWFVTILLFYYLLSPLLINCINNEKLILILVTFFLTSGFLLISHYFFRNLDVRVITYFPAYLLGLLISLKGDDFINKNGFFCIFIVGVFISILLKNNIRSFDLLSSIIMLATAPYFIFMLFKNRMKLSDNLIKTISILAYSSYCMYLFHRPIYITLKNIYFPESEALQVLYLVCFCLPCIIIFSYFVQKFYDSSIDSLTKSSAKLAKSHR